MGQPVPEIEFETSGRDARAIIHVAWTAVDADDLTDVILVNHESDISGNYENTRYAVEEVSWASALNVSADIEFDSLPRKRILSIPSEGTNGTLNFCKFPGGNISDPNRESPGNIVINTRGALPGDEMNIILKIKEKGIRKSPLFVVA